MGKHRVHNISSAYMSTIYSNVLICEGKGCSQAGQAICMYRCACVTLTLQTLVLLLHAEKENLLVDGLLPQSSIISSGAASALSSQALSGGEQPGQGVLVLL